MVISLGEQQPADFYFSGCTRRPRVFRERTNVDRLLLQRSSVSSPAALDLAFDLACDLDLDPPAPFGRLSGGIHPGGARSALRRSRSHREEVQRSQPEAMTHGWMPERRYAEPRRGGRTVGQAFFAYFFAGPAHRRLKKSESP